VRTRHANPPCFHRGGTANFWRKRWGVVDTDEGAIVYYMGQLGGKELGRIPLAVGLRRLKPVLFFPISHRPRNLFFAFDLRPEIHRQNDFDRESC
jgi:hypothetical protein